MKKIVAIILALVAVLTLSVSAMAANNSPVPTAKATVTIHSAVCADGILQEGKGVAVDIGSTVNIKKDDSEGKFDSWTIYKPDGSVAVEGTDYVIVSGSLKDPAISVTVFTDLIICGNYNGKITDPITGDKKDPVAPPTFDAAAIALVALMFASAAVAFTAKKKLCK